MYFQRTIKRRARVEGIGLHTGKPTAISFAPAAPDTGIHFVRKDMDSTPSMKASVEYVQATSMATTLGSEGFVVSTVEHCLSALAALRVDNLIIEMEGPEIPICDGSARYFLDALTKEGLIDQEAPRKYAYITEPIYVGDADKHAYVVPYNGLRVTCSIDFSHPGIGKQKIDLDVNETSFSKEIASARTFGFLKDVESLYARGLALGGSLENAVVLDETGVMNPEGLRYPDEFVRHKVLDALGDLVTLGMPLMGHVLLHRAGHDMMNKLVKKVLSTPQAYQYVELGAQEGSR